jgi:oxygen-independent coproporphyrinogen-3 oxidase
MFGIPEQTEESFLQTLEMAMDLDPSHISAYGLIIEEGTPFFRMESKLKLPDEEASERMYFQLIERLGARGWKQYEISNFAKKGYESKHNLKYWRCEEYLGFGPAAHSDFCGVRFGNSRDLAAYIEGGSILEEQNRIDTEERKHEYVMLGMRLAEGVDAKAFEARFGEPFSARFGTRLRRYEEGGFVRSSELGAAFTP